MAFMERWTPIFIQLSESGVKLFSIFFACFFVLSQYPGMTEGLKIWRSDFFFMDGHNLPLLLEIGVVYRPKSEGGGAGKGGAPPLPSRFCHLCNIVVASQHAELPRVPSFRSTTDVHFGP